MKVDLEQVVMALTRMEEEGDAYYSKYDERVVYPQLEDSDDFDDDFEDFMNSREYLFIERIDGQERYNIMHSFAQGQKNGNVKDWLMNSLSGKGAFRRFRASLERFGMEGEWYDYEASSLRALAMDWCEENGVVYEDRHPVKRFEHVETKEAPKKKEKYRIVNIGEKNFRYLSFMHADFTGLEPEDAEQEIEDLLKDGVKVVAASDKGRYVGYGMMDNSGLIALYVQPQLRRKGIGSLIFNSLGVPEAGLKADPADAVMLAFFQKQGFGVIESIVLRKKKDGEELSEEYALQGIRFLH